MKSLLLDELEKRIQQLPVLSDSVKDILGLFNTSDVDLILLQRKISQDQALAARILSVANSPFYGFAGQISSLKDACIVLGIHTIRNIVIATVAVEQFSPQKSNLLDRNALWQHSVATGVAGKILATQLKQDAETAFTAGLLHDLGKLVLDACLPDHYANVLRWRDEQDCSLQQAENKILGFDHTIVGARLAERWKLPVSLVAVIQYHHSPDLVSIPLVDILHLADLLSRALNIGNGGDNLIPEISQNAFCRLKLNWPMIGSMLNDIESVSSTALKAVMHNK